MKSKDCQGGMNRTVLRYQSNQCVSSGSHAIRQRLGVNLGDNKQKIGLKRSYRESSLRPDGSQPSGWGFEPSSRSSCDKRATAISPSVT